MGHRLVGFEDGYPVLGRGYARLPGEYCIKRRYGQLGIKPMVLTAAPPKSDGGFASNLPITAKPKPSPSVPAAPDDLPPEYDFCVQQEQNGTRFLRFRDPSHLMHGADVTASSQCDEDGMCHGGQGDMFWSAPTCSDPADDKEPVPIPCCVDTNTSMLVCPGSAYDSLVVQIVQGSAQEIGGISHVSVKHPDLPGGFIRSVPVCEPIDPDEPDEKPCCIEESTGMIVCPEGVDHPFAGQMIPLEYVLFTDAADGTRIARIDCGAVGSADAVQASLLDFCKSNGGMIFNACEKIPPDIEIPVPEPVPDLCCFDPETQSLVCEGSRFHGLVVRVVTTASLPDGTQIVSVEHPDLPGGGARLPFCMVPPEIPPDISTLPEVPDEVPVPEPDPEPEPEPEPEIEPVPDLPPPSDGLPHHCCYDESKQAIDCPGTDLHGLKVRLIEKGAVQNGWSMVKVEHPRFPRGVARMPVCKVGCGQGAYRSPEKGPSCADKWDAAHQKLARSSDEHCPGRRYGALNRGYCRGGTGIGDQHKNYGRFPGLRGGQRRGQ